jgi:hypothetical protein
MSEFLSICGFCLLFSLPICLIAWGLGRKRVHWNVFDFLVVVLPCGLWMFLAGTELRPKSLSNLFEVIYLAMGVPLAPIFRLIVGKRMNEKVVAAILLIVACGAGAIIYFLVPCLPE